MKQIGHHQHQMQQARPAPAGDAKQYVEDLFLVLNAIRRGWRLVLLCLLLALTVGLFQIFKTKPKYSATAQILVNQSGGMFANNMMNGDPITGVNGDFLTSHLAIIKSQAVLDDAIKAGKLDNVTFNELYVNLSVTRLERVLTLKFDSEDPTKPVKVVDAVIDAYKRFLESTFEKKTTDVVTLISKARDELSIELEKAEKDHIDFLQKHPQMMSDEAGRTMVTKRLAEWDRGIRSAKSEIFQLTTQIDHAQKLMAAGASDATIAKAIHTVATTIGADGGAGMHAEIAAIGDHSNERRADSSFEELTLHYAQIQYARNPLWMKLAGN